MIILPDHLERELVGGGRRAFNASGADPRSWVHSIGLLAEQRSERLTRPYAQCEWIYAAVRAISKALAAIPLAVWKGSRKDPAMVDAGPLAALIEDPTPDCGTEEWIQAIVSWIELRGEAFILPAGRDGMPMPPGSKEMPASLLVIAPTRLRAETDSATDRLVAWVADQDRVRLAPEQVIHIKLWNPYDAHRGMDPLALAVIIGEPIYQGNLFNAAILRNNGDPGGILKLKGKVDAAVLRRIKEGWMEAHGGPTQAGLPAVLDQDTDYVQNQNTHKDMQFLDLMKWGRDAIVGGIYGVPKGILSITDDLNYATQLGEERAFYTRTCLPLGRLIASGISRWFRKYRGMQEWLDFDPSNIAALQVNLAERMTVATSLKALGYTADEINERLELGMPVGAAWRAKAWTTGAEMPYDVLVSDLDAFSADEEPAAEPTIGAPVPAGESVADTALNGAQVASLVDIIAQVAAGTLPAESAIQVILVAFPQVDAATAAKMVNPAAEMELPEPAPAPVPPASGGVEEKGNAAGVADQPGSESERGRSSERALGDRTARREWLTTWNRSVLIPNENALYRVSLRLLARMRRITLANFRRVAGGKRKPMPPLSDTEIEAVLFSIEQWEKAVRELFDAPFWRTMEAAGKGIARELDAVFAMDKNDPRWLTLHGRRIAALVVAGKATRVAVRESIITALAEQTPVADLERAIASHASLSPARAMRIGRTETGALASGTRFEEMQANGVGKHEWVTAADDQVRESHQNLDGEIVAIGSAFGNGLKFPHDMDADDPGEIVNCRCSAVAVIDLDAE